MIASAQGGTRRETATTVLELLLSFKRAYLTGQRHLIAALRAQGLTPARLDVMRLVLDGVTTQKALRHELGIARSTISRMLASMEQRGLVVRRSKAPQRATKHVALAPGLQERVREVLELLDGAAIGAAATAFDMSGYRFRKLWDLLITLELGLETVRIAWGDRSRRRETPIVWLFDH